MAEEEHPAVVGRSDELATPAASVRRLAALTVTTGAEPALLERRVASHGRLVQDGQVTVEAAGRFAVFTPDQVRALGRRGPVETADRGADR